MTRTPAEHDAEHWDAQYSNAQQVWSGRPNGTLVTEVTGLAPGRVLDVGCGEGAFDLVSAQYPALLRTPGHDAERALLAALAPGGVVLVVHHTAIDVEQARAHGFDPEAYVSPSDVAELLGDDWEVGVDESRAWEVPVGGEGAHHTHDVVLRARRPT